MNRRAALLTMAAGLMKPTIEAAAPLHGETFPADAVPGHLSLPQHSGCDCIHSPVTEGWSQPEMIWLGG